jgi:hypothetical protein
VERFKGRFVKGSEPESVYWKRRGIVAGALVVLIVLTVLALKGLGGEDDETSMEGDAAQQEPSPTEPAVEACPPEQLMLQVVAAFDEVRSGSEVPVSVLVASAADTPCTVDLRSVAVELAAGSDVVYSTAHCETSEGEEVELSGGTGQTVEFTVDALASDEGCEGARRELPAGDYELRARLDDAVSSPAALRLT